MQIPETHTAPLPFDLAGENHDPDSGDDNPVTEQSVEGSVSDPAIETAIDQLLLEFGGCDPECVETVRSRVCGDIFHLHHQFPISVHHGLRQPFARALSAALFIPHPEDKAKVEAALRKIGVSYQAKLQSKPHWLLKRVRWYVPPPELLLPRVSAVFKTFGPLRDATTGLPLFNHRACEIAKNILENVRLGYFSDPPDVQLYYETGADKHGLTLY